MKRQQSPVLLALALSLLATNAWADGWEGKHPAPLNCAAPFAGAYLGVAAGYAKQHVDSTNLNPNSTSFGRTFGDSEGGFTAGGYAGYNWQRCGQRFAFGVETDFNYINTSPAAYDIDVYPAGTEIGALESRMDWFGTLRGRAGFVVNNRALLYATGGLAYGNVDHRIYDNCPGCASSRDLGTLRVSNTVTNTGWTAGGGVDYLHGSNWFLRAEALYVDLGSNTHHNTTPLLQNATGTTIVKWDDTFWVARLGLAYKFGAREDVVPLK